MTSSNNNKSKPIFNHEFGWFIMPMSINPPVKHVQALAYTGSTLLFQWRFGVGCSASVSGQLAKMPSEKNNAAGICVFAPQNKSEK